MKRTIKNDESNFEVWVFNVSGRKAFFEVEKDRFRPIEFQHWGQSGEKFENCWCERKEDNNITEVMRDDYQPVWLRALEAAARDDMMLLYRAEQLLRSVDEPALRMFDELTVNRVEAKDEERQRKFMQSVKGVKKSLKYVGHDVFPRFDETFELACLELINVSLPEKEKLNEFVDRRGTTTEERNQSVDDIGELEPFQRRMMCIRSSASAWQQEVQATDMSCTIRNKKTEHNTSLGWILHQSRNALAHNSLGCRSINLVPLWAELLTGGDMVAFNEFLGRQVTAMRGIVVDYLKPPR